MQLTINNQACTFVPIQTFRARWQLPDTFQINLFEPKVWEGLGTIEGAGPVLAALRRRVIQAVDTQINPANLVTTVDQLTAIFEQELEAANRQIGLRPVEIEFAVSGFYDVLQAVAFHLIQLVYTYQNNPAQISSQFNFAGVYQLWLSDSARVSSTIHVYQHAGTRFEVQVIYNAYGRVGLQVNVANQLHYVTDMSLACPASNYMQDLCRQVATALCSALTAP